MTYILYFKNCHGSRVHNNIHFYLQTEWNVGRVPVFVQRNYVRMGQIWPPLWSSGQSSWLQIRKPGFDSRHYQEKKSSGSGTGSTQPRREYGRRDPSRWPRGTLYPQKLAITSPTRGGRSVCIVRSRTQIMEFFLWDKHTSSNLWD
jgi:hypothetical protein